MVKRRMKQFSVRITEDRYLQMVREAERQEVTVALLARIALSEYCGRLTGQAHKTVAPLTQEPVCPQP